MFKVLTKEQYEALDVREQVKYEIELEAHKKAEQDKAVKDAVAKELENVKADQAKTVDELKAEFQAELKKAQDQAKADAEALEAKLKTQNAFNTDRGERAKTMTEYIMAKLSTEEGEDQIKEFLRGAKGALNTEVEAEKAVFSTPVGGVNPEITGFVGANYGRIHGRNVITVLPTLSNMISFLRLTPDPDADGIQKTAEGVLKGEIEYLSQNVQVPVAKLAGYLNLTDESLEDVVGFRAWLSVELPKAYLKVEDQYIFKDPTHGVYTLASAWVNDGAINPWDTLISAVAQLETVDNYATAIFVSPSGKKELLRNKDLINGLYTYPIVTSENGILRMNGLPIVSSSIFTGYQFLVGDFSSSAVTLHQRKAMTIRTSNEHDENFTKNLTTVLIEGRVAIAVRKTDAFVKGDLVVTPITT